MASVRARQPGALLLCLLCGCAAPEREPIDADALAQSVHERGRSIEVVQRALELGQIEPLALLPPALTEPIDADGESFWHACAYAYDADTRAARQRLLVARARIDSQGAPGPTALEVENQDFAGDDRETDVMLTFDLLGLLGTGRVGAARELARGEERKAFADLEAAVWSARFQVDRARAKVAAVILKLERMRSLLAEAEQAEPRIAILAERGWLPPSEIDWAHATIDELRHTINLLTAELADARAELGAAAGLPPDAPVIEAVSAATLARMSPGTSRHEPSAAELLSRLPRLRAQRFQYALAEANLRLVAAESWPAIGLGPRVVFTADDTLPGGVLRMDFPFPGANQGRVEAALAGRELERRTLEDQLLAAVREVARQRARLRELTSAWLDHAAAIDAAAASMWRAARARFWNDATALEKWSFALEHRIPPMLQLVEAQSAVILAALDLEEACGSGAVAAIEVEP